MTRPPSKLWKASIMEARDSLGEQPEASPILRSYPSAALAKQHKGGGRDAITARQSGRGAIDGARGESLPSR
jgi:hypothetical protein